MIVRAGGDRIDDLEPLWGDLSRHNAEVAPEPRRSVAAQLDQLYARSARPG